MPVPYPEDLPQSSYPAVFLWYITLSLLQAGHEQNKMYSTVRSYGSCAWRFTYLSPRWFVSLAICGSLQLQVGLPYLTVGIHRVREKSDKLRALCRRGDIDGLHVLFKAGLATPKDLHPDLGCTPLHVSFQSSW